MTRTDEAEAFFHAVYSAIQEIPHGKVTSYGHIARLIGTPQRPRQVGVCLKHLPAPSNQSGAQTAPSNHAFHSGNVPWQRVINAKGQISPRSYPAGATSQAAALRAEGVTVNGGAMGELTVDFTLFGWFPSQLPSEEAAGLVPFDDGDESDEEEEDDENGERDGRRKRRGD